MKFSAYMFVRNGIRAGYTFMEAIENVLPFVDEFFILEGESDDGTKEALAGLAARNPKVRLESALPEYVNAPKEAKGLLLGEAFEQARRKCGGDWLVQVQADTVFHPITLLAARDYLLRDGNASRYAAIEVLRRQYRWNWQDMYREDRLALIFRKEGARVTGDAINLAVDGPISRALSPLFRKFPAADNAWIFFENIIGKRNGCAEIWGENVTPEFAWYDKATGRSFQADSAAYAGTGALPPLWNARVSPFMESLPRNLHCHVGAVKYEVPGRFAAGELYSPGLEEILLLLREAGSCSRFPFRLPWR